MKYKIKFTSGRDYCSIGNTLMLFSTVAQAKGFIESTRQSLIKYGYSSETANWHKAVIVAAA